VRTTNHNYLKESSGMTGMGQGRKRPAVSARTTFHGCCYSVSCEAVPQGKSVIGLSVTANRRVSCKVGFLAAARKAPSFW
jgi:hypothetical protein